MVKVALIGAGSRGLGSYGKWIQNNPGIAQVVSVADPLTSRRREAANRFSIAPDHVFNGWKGLLDAPKTADAVIIATTDSDHVEPAILAAEKGYHILLEKPMAPTAKECARIVDSVQRNGVLFTICHVLRYAPFYKRIKELIDSGRVGKLCAIKHLEGVAWWHFAHSFVRGNWRNESLSSNILLAKCCHDLDILNWYAGSRCKHIQSFGKLNYFRPENAPEGSAKRCLDCRYCDSGCPYSAKKIYSDRLNKGLHSWPLDVVTNTMSPEALEESLRYGPYGRCVFHCDNDVMDTQSVNIEYENGLTVSMMLSAFTPHGRKIQIMGSDAFVEGDGSEIRILDFHTGQYKTIDVNSLSDDVAGGHGGGDCGLMESFVKAVAQNSSAPISGDTNLLLESHLLAFAAEESRKQNQVIHFGDYCERIGRTINYRAEARDNALGTCVTR